jgi:hypothetical protein
LAVWFGDLVFIAHLAPPGTSASPFMPFTPFIPSSEVAIRSSGLREALEDILLLCINVARPNEGKPEGDIAFEHIRHEPVDELHPFGRVLALVTLLRSRRGFQPILLASITVVIYESMTLPEAMTGMFAGASANLLAGTAT